MIGSRLLQGACVAVFLGIVLVGLHLTSPLMATWIAGTSTLASSAYVVFTLPHYSTVAHKRLIGGYVVAIIVGHVMHYMMHFSFADNITWEIILGALGAGVALIIMVRFDVEH